MPYKDINKRRAQQRKYKAEKIMNDPVLLDKYLSYVKSPDAKKRYYNKLKLDDERLSKHKKSGKDSYLRNKTKYSEKAILETKNLSDSYIYRQLKKDGIPLLTIKNNPDLIIAKRLLLNIKRITNGTN